MIALSGNLGFLNLLTIIPGLALLDDEIYKHIFSYFNIYVARQLKSRSRTSIKLVNSEHNTEKNNFLFIFLSPVGAYNKI